MTRVSCAEYYRRHCFVRMLFSEPALQIFFTVLNMNKQWELHQYYATDHDFSELEFLEHRRELDKRSPSLGHRAGKHFKVLECAFIEASRAQGFTRQQMKQAVTVHSSATMLPRGRRPVSTSLVAALPVVKPLDADKLAKVLIALARHQQQQATSSLSSGQSRTSFQAGSATIPGAGDERPPQAAAA